MEYQNLVKLYYTCSQAGVYPEWRAEVMRRLRSPDTIKLGLKLAHDNEAFVCADYEMQKLLDSIYSLNMQIATERARISRNINKCKVNSVVAPELVKCEYAASNAIEGMRTAESLVDSLLAKKKPCNKHSSIWHVLHEYKKILESKNIVFPKTSSEIRAFYDKTISQDDIDDDNRGLPYGEIFREKDVHIGGLRYESTGVKGNFGIEGEANIVKFMDKALEMANSRKVNGKPIDPVLSAVIFQGLFVYAHPFYDGNGRTSRLLTSMLLKKTPQNRRIDPAVALGISQELYENDKKLTDCYKLFHHRRNMGDMTPFAMTFVECIEAASKKTLDHFRNIDINNLSLNRNFELPNNMEEREEFLRWLQTCDCESTARSRCCTVREQLRGTAIRGIKPADDGVGKKRYTGQSKETIVTKP